MNYKLQIHNRQQDIQTKSIILWYLDMAAPSASLSHAALRECRRICRENNKGPSTKEQQYELLWQRHHAY